MDAAPVSGPPKSRRGSPHRALVGAVVEMVMVAVLAMLPLGVTVAGEKLHVDSLGNPEHESVTC
jgi:hypothetical protein